MMDGEWNHVLDQVLFKIRDEKHGICRGIIRHNCGSCGLTDEEYAEIRAFNDGVLAAASAIEKMKR